MTNSAPLLNTPEAQEQENAERIAELEQRQKEAEERQRQQSNINNFRMLQYLTRQLNGQEINQDELGTSSQTQPEVTEDINSQAGETATDAMYRTGMVEGSIEPVPEQTGDVTDVSGGNTVDAASEVIDMEVPVAEQGVGSVTDATLNTGADIAGSGVEATAEVATGAAEIGADVAVEGAELGTEALTAVAEIAPEAALAVVAL